MERNMSDDTKVMASPDEAEETAGGTPAAAGVAADEGGAEESAEVVVGAGAEPSPEVRGAFGTQEYTAVGDDPERGAEAGSVEAAADSGAQAASAGEAGEAVAEPVEAAAEPADVAAETGATEADAPAPPAEQVAGAVTAPAGDRPGGAEETAEAGDDAGDDADDAGGQADAAGAPPSGLAALRKARDERRPVEGRVFGWNPGGFHVVIDGIAAFCPRSEMELEPIAEPESYLDKTFEFRILKIQGKARRIVVSRTALLREDQEKSAADTMKTLRAGAVVKGKVASLTDFGAFVDIGGVEGLVHVSEISRSRVNKPSDALQVGQEVEVKILKVERGGRRVSLSMKALEPDPWREVKEKYPEGAVVVGKVERTSKPGAFIALEPGLVGLLPTSEMGLPREAIPARAYPPGKEVRVQVVSVDPRRQRIGLAPEGSLVEGTKSDYNAFLKQQQRDEEVGFKPFAAALQKLKKKD
jgi:predicted RNA-binding protein with RPS1 domain